MELDPLMRVQATGPHAVPLIKLGIRRWIDSQAFRDTIRAFGWVDDPAEELRARIATLVARSEEWDFRRRTAKIEASGEATRWTAEPAQLTGLQATVTMQAARELHLDRGTSPIRDEYRSILVLGGGRLSCLVRTEWAAELLESGVRSRDVVLLGSARAVARSERAATNSYAPAAATEFELFLAAGRRVFQFEEQHYIRERWTDPRPNGSWEIRQYNCRQARVLAMSAPSTRPDERRADSADTYSFYVTHSSLRPGDGLLLVTSPIYAPYQQLEGLRVMGVPSGLYVETVGVPPERNIRLPGIGGPQHYLQEMRSFLQSAGRFLEAYPD